MHSKYPLRVLEQKLIILWNYHHFYSHAHCRSVQKGKHQTEWWWWWIPLPNRILNIIFHTDMLRIASDAGNYVVLLLMSNCQF